MSMLGIEPIRDASIKITARRLGAGEITVEFDGVLGHRDPKPLLAPLLDAVHNTAQAQQIKKVIVDLRNLRFMNSSSFKYFVGWVKANNALDPVTRYRIHFLLQPAHHWQRVSIHALGCFSSTPITSENVAGDP